MREKFVSENLNVLLGGVLLGFQRIGRNGDICFDRN